jgi:hypothetical protein
MRWKGALGFGGAGKKGTDVQVRHFERFVVGDELGQLPVSVSVLDFLDEFVVGVRGLHEIVEYCSKGYSCGITAREARRC